MSAPDKQTPIEDLRQAWREGWGELAGLGVFYLAWYIFGIAIFSVVAVLTFGWLGQGALFLWSFFFPNNPAVLSFGWLGEAVRQVAWCGGALLAAVTMPLGWVRIGAFSRPYKRSLAPEGPPYGVLASILVMGIVGVICGALLMAYLGFVWCSLALSPFAPDSWRLTVSPGIFMLSGNYPLPYVFLGIWGGFVLLCLLLGCILGPLGKVRR
jgi:hypothetical protein